MAIDYREKEREFLDGLEEATGRSLDAWMAAISEQNFTERNDLIDWLRQQGFMFSKASWLERVHHNGGKPIYSNAPPPRASKPREKTAKLAETADLEAPELEPIKPAIAATPTTDADPLQATLAGAKGLRPLAVTVLKLVQSSVPNAEITPHAQHLSFACDGRDFAVLIVGAKDLRLAIALPQPPLAPWQAAKFANPALRIAAHISQMLVLSDVRQLTPDVGQLIAASAMGGSQMSAAE